MRWVRGRPRCRHSSRGSCRWGRACVIDGADPMRAHIILTCFERTLTMRSCPSPCLPLCRSSLNGTLGNRHSGTTDQTVSTLAVHSCPRTLKTEVLVTLSFAHSGAVIETVQVVWEVTKRPDPGTTRLTAHRWRALERGHSVSWAKVTVLLCCAFSHGHATHCTRMSGPITTADRFTACSCHTSLLRF
jgi:hypothetical protein